MAWMALLYVAMGGAVGALARYGAGMLASRFYSGDFPVATFAVNIAGGFLMGAWIALASAMPPERARELHLLFAVGALGGFTTFSTFSLDLFILMQRGLMWQAALYAAGSVLLALAALMAGMWAVAR